MLETVQIPILLKAIDFIFEEGRKILEERRERRKAGAKPGEDQPPKDADDAEPKSLILPKPDGAAAVKQDLLAARIDKNIWQNNEAEVNHLVRLLETYSQNYHLASEQYAKWGSALVPPIVVHNMTEAENAFLETASRLEALLARIYENKTQHGE